MVGHIEPNSHMNILFILWPGNYLEKNRQKLNYYSHLLNQTSPKGHSIQHFIFVSDGGGFDGVLSDVLAYLIRLYSAGRLRRWHGGHFTVVKAGVRGHTIHKRCYLYLVSFSLCLENYRR